MMAAMNRRLSAWLLLVVVFLVCSCAAPALCSARPLAASASDDGDDARREAWVADGAVMAAAGGHSGEVWSRRSLGFRSPGSPPAPLWNNPTTMPVPPPPWV
ncbi:unnamed protein product [Urochloa decumbens]|uniref:Uncharacterized protein n=1 Tax=Urochloa decumbens TaxID=240449 RepID=A0ABC9DRF7_9POAL